jgi:DNA-binding transcriptional MerR regulator
MGMTVGAVAKAAGVSAKAVRLWESKGLLPPAERSQAGYRIFTEDDLGVLRFIRQAKTLGLTLPQIKDILDLQRGGQHSVRSTDTDQRTEHGIAMFEPCHAKPCAAGPAWERREHIQGT